MNEKKHDSHTAFPPGFKGQLLRRVNEGIALLAIGVNEVTKGTIVTVFPVFLPLFFSFQFVGSTIQGGISDVLRRKHVFTFALVAVILSSFLAIFADYLNKEWSNTFSITAIILLGLCGNAGVVSRATLIDIHYHVDRRLLMGWTVLAESGSWVFVGAVLKYTSFPYKGFFWICGLGALLLSILSPLSRDTTKSQYSLSFVRAQLKEYKTLVSLFWASIIAITIIVSLGEGGFFTYFYDLQNQTSGRSLQSDTLLLGSSGMVVGTWLQGKFKHINDKTMIILGCLISILGVMLFFLTDYKILISIFSKPVIESVSFCVVGFGSGFFLPCFYALISRGHNIHYQGMLTGWIDSIRTAGDFLTTTLLRFIAPASFVFPLYTSLIFFILTIIFTFLFFRYWCLGQNASNTNSLR